MSLLFEIIHAASIGIVFFYLFFKSRKTILFKQDGWVLFLTGFGLLFLGTVADISDQFPELSFLIIFGQTDVEYFVEKILGYTVGGIFVFLGSIRFVPALLQTFVMKEELKKTNEALESKVKERTVELEKANTVKNEFISIMSHEIRTPLNAIKGMTYQLRKSTLDANQKKRANNIDLSADLLLSIFNNILYYSETESGKLKISKIDFSFKEISQQLFYNYKEMITGKNIQFVIKSEGDVADIINGDPEIIKRIAMIFIENAIKYSDKGKIEVSCKVLTDKENKNKVSVSVSDTGIGISDEKINIITQSFSQSEEISAKKLGEIGLGLAIVGRLCAITNGELQVESKRNVGSKFTVLLPCEVESDSASSFYFDNIEDLRNENQQEDIKIIDQENINKINESFSILENLLKQYDSDAINILEQITTDYGLENKFKSLRLSIQNYKFEEALIDLENIKKEFN